MKYDSLIFPSKDFSLKSNLLRLSQRTYIYKYLPYFTLKGLKNRSKEGLSCLSLWVAKLESTTTLYRLRHMTSVCESFIQSDAPPIFNLLECFFRESFPVHVLGNLYLLALVACAGSYAL